MNIPLSYPTQAARFMAIAAILAGLSLVCAVSPAHAQVTEERPRSLDVPYVPTPQPVVDKMLDLAKVKKGDVVYDLGCGDGRIVITAVKERGARGVGIDLNPQRIAEAKINAKEAKVEDKVKFEVGDLFKADFSEATVVTLYLLPSVNAKLRPQLWRQLKIGTRVVSHAFDMGTEWPPEKTETVGGSTVYYWTITKANKDAAAGTELASKEPKI
jgi:SAM-dependent methyltransferase